VGDWDEVFSKRKKNLATRQVKDQREKKSEAMGKYGDGVRVERKEEFYGK